MVFALTSLGNVRGKRCKTKANFQYLAFYKVPFAKPPIGSLRFALPEPVEPWTGTLDCSKRESIECLQVNVISPESKFLIGSEDCLYLNVYTPHLPEPGVDLVLPVVVWIHGGAFCVGSNDYRFYGPDFLIDQGVVLVAVNYRLGPLGFFCLENDFAPGNQGLHDQVAALRWVRDHIQAFGGDKTNVTIMGESAGAMSCFLHFVSPMSRGLFHKVIAMSGSATSPFLHLDRRPSIYAKTLAKNFGAKSSDSDEEIVQLMRAIPGKTIVQKTTMFKDWDVVNPMPWKPVVDGFASTPFLPVSFADSIKRGNFAPDVPFIVGFTSEEGLILSAPFHRSLKRWNLLFDQWERWAPLLFFNREPELVTKKDLEAVDAVRRKFFRSDHETSTPAYNEGNLRLLEQIFSVSVFQAPLCRDIDLMKSHGVQVFSYNFTYVGSMTLTELFRLPTTKLLFNFSGRFFGAKLFQKKLGPCHGDDLLYLFPFNVPGFPKSLRTDEDKRTSVTMTKLFTNFAKTGMPTPQPFKVPGWSGSSVAISWQCQDETSKVFLNLGDQLSVGELDLSMRRRVDFWNKVVDESGHLEWIKSNVKINKIFSETADKRSSLFSH